MTPKEIERIIATLTADFDAIQMPRPPFVLEKLVVGAQDHPAQAWAQCVLEMQIKYDNIRRAMLKRRILKLEIERLRRTRDEIKRLEAQMKEIDIEEQDRAMLGAIREFEALHAIYLSFGRRYTREQLDAAQAEYWQLRLSRQARQDLLAGGRVSVGNQEALRQISVGLPGTNEQIEVTQRRYLASGNRRLLIVVPTEEKAEGGLPCIEGLKIPSGVEYRIHNIFGLPVADAYNEAGLMVLQEGADYLLTVEDDTFPPDNALFGLMAHDVPIVGAWYPKRREPREGVPIVVVGGKRQGLDKPDGEMWEAYTIPQGCTLMAADVFRKLPFPWFVTTPQLSQDSYFSQLARDAGYTLWCDTSIRCRHVDRVTGKVYE